MAKDPLQEALDDVESLRTLAKGAERGARLMKQLAARAAENIENLQSEEDTRKNASK